MYVEPARRAPSCQPVVHCISIVPLSMSYAASQEESGNESDEEEQDLHGKRSAGNENKVNEGPRAKEPRKELPTTGISSQLTHGFSLI